MFLYHSNPSPNTYSVVNDGNFNNEGGQAVMELMATKFFTALDAYERVETPGPKIIFSPSLLLQIHLLFTCL